MNNISATLLISALACASLPFPAFAQAPAPNSPSASVGLYAYPENNQSASQQAKDENECFGSAKQQTGVDPFALRRSPERRGAEGGAATSSTGSSQVNTERWGGERGG